MTRGIILAGLLMGTSTAHAATYYVSDCQAGAVLGCVAGQDSDAGTDPGSPWKTFDKFHAMFDSLKAGDHVLFARGGTFTGTYLPLRPPALMSGSRSRTWICEGEGPIRLSFSTRM
jgi:hypothetical protein